MASVLCIGVAVQDFIYFVDEMPRAAEKYNALDFMTVGGGCAATAAVAVARLGGDACLAARLGDDLLADLIVSELEGYGVDCTYMLRFAGKRSPLSSIFVDQAGERLIMGFRDRTMPAGGDRLSDPLPRDVDVVLADTHWVQGGVDLMRCAEVAGKPRVLDGEPPFDGCQELIALSTHIVFSAQGLRELSGVRDFAEGMKRVGAMTGAWLAVTDGAKGVYYLDDGQMIHVSVPQVEVVDTLGAGDTWHGAFALALAEGRLEVEAITFANIAASLKCTCRGGRAGVPDRAAVDAYIMGHAFA
jgi:sulfofructose kinase